MIVIFTIILVITIILIAWMWTSLGSIEKTTKIACIILGLIIVYIMTFIIYNISKIGITYEDKEVMKTIRKVFVLLFTIINSYIILPYTFRKLDQINNEEIEKEKLTKSITILLGMVAILAICEGIYLSNIQQGTLNLIKK